MIRFIRSTLNPSAYQGFGKPAPYFEGWYFKLVNAQENCSYAVIPGVFRSADSPAGSAFVQFFDGRSGTVTRFDYPYTEFASARRRFDINIGPNRFRSDALLLNLQNEHLTVRGHLRFKDTTPWPVTWRSPGIMGWYAWAPFMQCYHGVVSLDHRIAGRLEVNSQAVDFTEGRGYIEKDWGRAFPSSWIWVQCNHFEVTGVALTASVAIIPWIRGAFPGFIIGLHHRGNLFRFATYTGARILQLSFTDDEVQLTVADRRHELRIFARRQPPVGLLHAPSAEGMTRRIGETLAAEVAVSLRKGRQIIFEGHGRHGGLEMVGDLAALIDMWRSAGKR